MSILRLIRDIVLKSRTSYENYIMDVLINTVASILVKTKDGVNFMVETYKINIDSIIQNDEYNNELGYMYIFDDINISVKYTIKNVCELIISDSNKCIVIDMSKFVNKLVDNKDDLSNPYYELKQYTLYNINPEYFIQTSEERKKRCDSMYEVNIIKKLVDSGCLY